MLACLYAEDHAAPLIDLLEASASAGAGASRDSPLSLIVLHLTELARRPGRLRVLKPHRRRSGADPTPSDRIVNAFRHLAEQRAAPGAAASRTVSR